MNEEIVKSIFLAEWDLKTDIIFRKDVKWLRFCVNVALDCNL